MPPRAVETMRAAPISIVGLSVMILGLVLFLGVHLLTTQRELARAV
jgi:hypothetical protein